MLLWHEDHGRDPGGGPIDNSGGGLGIGDDHLQRPAGQHPYGFHLQQMNVTPEPTREPSATEPKSAVVEFRNVTISFDGPPVLRDLSFSVGPLETRILLG